MELRQIFIFAIGYIGGRDIRVGVCACSTFSLNFLYSRGICHLFAEQPFNGILEATMRSSLFSLNKKEFVEYLPLRTPISLLNLQFSNIFYRLFPFLSMLHLKKVGMNLAKIPNCACDIAHLPSTQPSIRTQKEAVQLCPGKVKIFIN